MAISYSSSAFQVLSAAAGLLLLISSQSVVAQTGNPNGNRQNTTPVAIKPIYNPSTKSYFELRVDLPKPSTWEMAVRYARTKQFKGVRGQLAEIKSIQTHSFLQANFDVREEAWIGLRYFCAFRKLVWADGTEQPRSKFKMWARRWHRTEIRCGKNQIQYMPIYYQKSDQGFKWQASGPSKHFVSYFVEYPTGSENPALERKKAAKNAADKTAKSAEKPAAETPVTPEAAAEKASKEK